MNRSSTTPGYWQGLVQSLPAVLALLLSCFFSAILGVFCAVRVLWPARAPSLWHMLRTLAGG